MPSPRDSFRFFHAELGSGPESDERCNVVLLDDQDHSYEYVIDMLMQVFGYTVETAYLMALEVDTCGRVVVATTSRAAADGYRGRLQGFGRDPRIPRSRGPMMVVIEALPAA